MYKKGNYGFGRIFAFSIYLLIAVLCFGKSIGTVHANTPNNVFYVNGNVTESGAGTTAGTAYKTLAEAYAAIPTENTETVIVICGPVDASNSGLKYSGSSYYLPEHSGKVILTSTYDNVDYNATANAGLNFNSKTFYLLGNTTFRNIHITGQANEIYADFYELHFAKGITKAEGVTYTAEKVYAGTGTKMAHDSFPKKNIAVSDVTLTIDSGDFSHVYGGGSGSRSESTGHAVNITINGGTIGTLTGSGWSSSGSYLGDVIHNNISIAINGGTISNLYGVRRYAVVNGNIEVLLGANAGVPQYLYAYENDTVTVIGEKILTYKGTANATLSTGTRKFSVLKLENSILTVPNESGATTAWGAFNKVVLTDDSKLSLGLTPTNAVSVEVTKSGTDWQTTIPIITAPSGTGNVFSLTSPTSSSEISLTYATADVASWTLQAIDETYTGPVLFVDGVGSGLKDGSSAENAFATLKEAYEAIPASNESITIVICGSVSANAGYDAATGSDGAGAYYFLPAHDGKVVLTSKWDGVDYRTTKSAELKFGGVQYYFFGDTTFKNINITEKAKYLYANYYAMHFAKGITATDTIADYLYMGTTSKVGANTEMKDVSLIIDSGTFTRIYGGGNNSQGGSMRGKNNSITIEINGGTVTTALFGSGLGNSDCAHHKSISITVNDGTIKSLYGAHKDATVYNGIDINLYGGSVSYVAGACKPADSYKADVIPTIKGDITITYGADIVSGSLKGIEDGANLEGKAILLYKDANTALRNVVNFSALNLINSTISVQEAVSATWNSLSHLMLTDNSKLTLEFTPTLTEKISVEVTKSGDEWQTATPIISAPSGTADLFKLISPLNCKFVYDGNAASWTLVEGEVNIGQAGTAGTLMNIDLGLRKDGSFTPLAADATPYQTFLAKLNDLGEAKSEVKIVSPFAITGAIELHVNPQNGNDENIGSMGAPFRTIEKALGYVKALEDLDIKGIVIYLHGGTYSVSDTISLNASHSGANGYPVIISAYGDGEVVISGGTSFSGSNFSKVTDEAVLNRFQAAVRDKIVAVNLKDQGITNFGAITGGAQGGPNYKIFVNGEELTIARYPNATQLAVGEILDIGPVTATNSEFPYGTNKDSTGIEYKMQDLRPTLWQADENIWLKGALYAEWDIQNIRVAEIRTEKGTVKLDGGAHYGARVLPTNTYFYYNVLEELDVPGEYYLDTQNGILYMYPIGEMSDATVTYCAMSDDLIELYQTENVILNGLTIENSGGRGIFMEDCYRTVVQNCVIRQVGTGAVIDGRECGVIFTDIEQTSNRPVEIKDAQTNYDYTPDHNFLQNCYIHTTGTQNEKYSGVYMQGTGNIVSHNLIQGTFSVSIYVHLAKECIIEYNEVIGGPTGSLDSGSIYVGYTPNDSGHHIRYNYIHDIGISSNTNQPRSIYLDEGSSGNYVYGNISSNIPHAFYTNSGSENVVVNNVAINGREGTVRGIGGISYFEGYTIDERIARTAAVTTAYNTYMSLSDADKATLRSRYPLQAKFYDNILAIKAEDGNGSRKGVFVSRDNYVGNNLLYNCGAIQFGQYIGDARNGNHTIVDNTYADMDPFVDTANHNFALKSGASWNIDTNVPLYDMARFGILLKTQGGVLDSYQRMDTFTLYAPTDGNNAVDPKGVMLKWTNAGGADTYTVTIAKNEALTESPYTITVEDNQCYLDEDEYFEFASTYYWTVTASTTAKTRIADDVKAGAIYAFTTMTEEAWLEANRANVTELEETLSEANELLAGMVEVSEGGLYYAGSKTLLAEAIDAAKAVLNTSNISQEEVNDAVAALNQAIKKAKVSRKEQYITFEQLAAADWSDPAGMKGVATVVGDELQFTFSTSNSLRSEMAYAKPIGVRDILKFQFKLDDLKAWNGFAIAQSNTNAVITAVASTNGYFICIKPDQIELQKRNNGKSYGNIAVYANKIVDENGNPVLDKNGAEIPLMTGNTWYDITIAALNETDGSVHILFKVGDTVVFDYLDKEDAITGSEGFGVVIPTKDNGTVYLKKADASAMPTPAPSTSPEPSASPEPSESLQPSESPIPSTSPKLVILDGTDTYYTNESDEEVSVHCSGDIEEFVSVDMDGQVVDKSNYSIKEGSTILIFANAYLDSLAVGEHTVTLHYTGNRSIDSKLTIFAATSDDDSHKSDNDSSDDVQNDSNGESVEAGSTADTTTPNTGDGSNIFLWTILVIAVMGVGLYLLLKSKNVKLN